MRTKSAFNREHDERVNGDRQRECRAHGVPYEWVLLTRLECQALLDDVVPTKVKEMIVRALRDSV